MCTQYFDKFSFSLLLQVLPLIHIDTPVNPPSSGFWIISTIISTIFNIKIIGDNNNAIFCPFLGLDAGWKNFIGVSVVLTLFVVLFVVYWVYYLIFAFCCADSGQVWGAIPEADAAQEVLVVGGGGAGSSVQQTTVTTTTVKKSGEDS